MLAGILVLALMIMPLVVLTADAALERVPAHYHTSATALGLSDWAYIGKIGLPQALPGIVTGVILQLGRALGETMAVLMVCGNVVQWPGQLTEPVRTITANIALEMAYAMDMHQHALYVSGLLLIAVTTGLMLLAHSTRRWHYVAH